MRRLLQNTSLTQNVAEHYLLWKNSTLHYLISLMKEKNQLMVGYCVPIGNDCHQHMMSLIKDCKKCILPNKGFRSMNFQGANTHLQE